MTTSLQRHLLLKLSKAQTLGEKGFTLIELLVVIIIIGILAAVALPSLLSQTDRAKASEAKTTLGAINRAQEAYYMEHNSFAPDAAALGTGGDTANFSFTMDTSNASVLKTTATGATGTQAAAIGCEINLTVPSTSGGAFSPSTITAVSGLKCP